jgi:hypothetical protein
MLWAEQVPPRQPLQELLMMHCPRLLLLVLLCLAAGSNAAETTDPIRATVQVRYGNSSGSGTAISPTLILSCAHIHAGERAGQAFAIAKHWRDGTDQFRGYLVAEHAELDLALIAVPEADFDHVQMIAADPPTPQSATFYGHAAARREILSFRGYVARGYTTHFDIVAGHDSLEGQSGGGVFDAQGQLLGVMHGRPHQLPSDRGGGIFTPVRHIRRWIETDCRGPRCQPYLPPWLLGNSPAPRGEQRGDGRLTPPPARACPPSSATPPVALQPLLDRLDELSARLDRLALRAGPPGPPGERGPQGDPGESAAIDRAALGQQIQQQLMPLIDQRIEEAVARRVPHYFSIVPRQPKGK